MPSIVPAQWGGESDSLDYEPLIDGDLITDPLISLVSHSVTGISFETLDAVFQNYVKKIRNRIVRFRKTLRPAEAISGTLTINIGNAIWSPVLQIARTKGACARTLWLSRLCPENPDWWVAYGYTGLRMNPATRPNDAVTVQDAALAEWQVEATFEREIILFATGLYINSIQVDTPIYAVAVMTEDCQGCGKSDTPYLSYVAGGGDGTGDPFFSQSDDRFATFSAIANTIPDDHVVTSIWTQGNIILAGFSDDPSVAAGATGGTVFSADRGATAATIDSNITESVFGVTKFKTRYLAVGGTAAGDGLLWESTGGVSWTPVSTGSLATANAFTAIAVDDDNEVFFVVGQAGVCLLGRLVGTTITLSALTLPDSPGTLFSVAVLAPDHIVVGGAANYFAESLDGGDTWVHSDVAGSAAVLAVAGTPYNTFIGVGTKIYHRSPETDMEWDEIPPKLGATMTGNVTSLSAPADENNYVAFGTDDGESGLISPLFPRA